MFPVAHRVATAALVLGIAGATACTKVQQVRPTQFIPEHSPDLVWVTHLDNTVLQVERPKVSGDTLHGVRRGTADTLAIPLGQVRSVEVRTSDGAKTALLVTTAGIAAAAGAYFLFASGDDESTGTTGTGCGLDGDGAPVPFC